jgi:hypothetical protein
MATVPGSGGTVTQRPPPTCTSSPSTSCCTIMVTMLSSQCADMDMLVSVSSGAP